ncbi:hypothetical protein EVAR_52443_1 [Eumeta japonica]|uniref:Uncharacterized protein n=1 Tax=Eumeta variegata TaxID=151549 RepID=A0A4C1YKR2_EUMVA|nr:hypothetical protein EVAR_52443_1 [Eumeta japonica]
MQWLLRRMERDTGHKARAPRRSRPAARDERRRRGAALSRGCERRRHIGRVRVIWYEHWNRGATIFNNISLQLHGHYGWSLYDTATRHVRDRGMKYAGNLRILLANNRSRPADRAGRGRGPRTCRGGAGGGDSAGINVITFRIRRRKRAAAAA